MILVNGAFLVNLLLLVILMVMLMLVNLVVPVNLVILKNMAIMAISRNLVIFMILAILILVILGNLTKLVQSVTNIFEYSNILVTNICFDIRSYRFFLHKYIRTSVCVKLVCTNIFGQSFVSVLECKN